MKTTKVLDTRPAGGDYVVVTIKGGRAGLYRREPCAKCPWRVDAIGEFPAEAFRHSANTAHDMADRTFGCHESGKQKPATCAGFLLKNSANNFSVRMALGRGDIDLSQITDGGHKLHDSYKAMAIANGVPANDEALALCRSDGQ